MPPSSSPDSCSAVLLAAGSSTRMGSTQRKPFLRVVDRTVLEHACAAFEAVDAVREVVLVAREEDVGRMEDLRAASPAMTKVSAVVAGGSERTHSVRLGVGAASPDCELIAVHDVARALVTPAVVARAIELAARKGAAVVAVPVRDTLKRAEGGDGIEHAVETVDRGTMFAAQTPQVFRADEFRSLLLRAEREGFAPTDDAALWERWVGPVPIAAGEADNLKLTTPADLVVAAAILEARFKGAR